MTTRFRSFDDTDPSHRPGRDGGGRQIAAYFGAPGAREGRDPQGFLVEMGPHSTIQPHFHPVDQFQVFLGAPGATYRRSPLEGPTVHYTDAYSTYGPVTTGDAPLAFFTLRPWPSQFTAYMPEDRDKLVARGRRNLDRAVPSTDVHAEHGVVCVDLFDEDDGMAARVLASRPGEALPCPSPANTAGQYSCVLEGSIRWDGTDYGPRSLGWSDPDDHVPTIVATGDAPCRLLVLSYPVGSNAA